ncbi:hypothetical protein [Nostoc sp.]|uniref:hypothetical protein n=1 Tax=Nostoc sp. TaxID=1180 RepID=UPI002FF747B1
MDWQEFLPWHTINREDFPSKGATELEVLIQGILDKRRFLELDSVRTYAGVTENVDTKWLAAGYHRGRRGHGGMRVLEGFCVSPKCLKMEVALGKNCFADLFLLHNTPKNLRAKAGKS